MKTVICLLRSLKQVIWKKPVFFFYLHYKSAMLILKWEVLLYNTALLKIQLYFIILAKLSIQLLCLDAPPLSLSREFYKTRNTGTRNSGGRAEHWWNKKTGISWNSGHENIGQTQCRTTTYWANNIAEFKTRKLFLQERFL